MQSAKSIDVRYFINYKFFNSVFTGLSIGSIFSIYTPLQPSVYSVGGIALALTMLVIAKFYTKIMNRRYFYRISLAVELVMLAMVCYFLLFSYSYTTALIIYVGYQSTFSFGSYLVRAETVLFRRSKILTFLDVAKQKGYLSGLVLSFLFYKTLEYLFAVLQNSEQVYYLHFLLFVVEAVTIIYLLRAFRPSLKGRS
ncbi:hypothetical protein KKE54_03920 [bacterium]|jgi:putative membrane protein|nr:hypothetical protein [bacterium]